MGRILILGGDGFCGWPTALHLSSAGHDITIVDNLVRRQVDVELNAASLTPIAPLDVRRAAWKELTGATIRQPFRRHQSDPPQAARNEVSPVRIQEGAGRGRAEHFPVRQNQFTGMAALRHE